MTVALDTSAVVGLANRDDPNNAALTSALKETPGPYVVPAGILSEVGYMMEVRGGASALDAFLRDLETGALLLDCGDEDLARVRELIARYYDLPLGFSDAAVVACAERRAAKVLTLDRRDFDVIAGESGLSIIP